VTRTRLGPALVLPLLACLACEPIAAPATESRDTSPARLEAGDRLPEFLLTDQADNAVTPATLRGSVVTLTFVVPGAAQPAPFLQRIDDVYDRLGADGIHVRRYLVTLVAGGDASLLAQRSGWLSLRGDPETVGLLAARFGVVSWPGADGDPVQTVGVAIIGPDGLVAARFGGLETWQEMDLLLAIAEAGR